MTRQQMLDACMDLMAEIQRADDLHGDWSDYDAGHICKAVCDEHDEYMLAYIANDLSGEHGQRKELLQVACTAIKGYVRLGNVNDQVSHLLPADAAGGQPKDFFAGRCGYCLQPVQAG